MRVPNPAHQADGQACAPDSIELRRQFEHLPPQQLHFGRRRTLRLLCTACVTVLPHLHPRRSRAELRGPCSRVRAPRTSVGGEWLMRHRRGRRFLRRHIGGCAGVLVAGRQARQSARSREARHTRARAREGCQCWNPKSSIVQPAGRNSVGVSRIEFRKPSPKGTSI